MSITSAIVFYLVIWAVVFLIINPLWQTSQAEDGHVIPGTPASAPVDAMVKRKAMWTTLWATVAFIVLYCLIEYEIVTLESLSWAEPPSARTYE
ncbi:MAG: DUF1467 family protein [Pseudomonadota bacterium]